MARTTKRFAVTGEVKQNYWQVADMPWDKIERQTGHKFSQRARQEIHTFAYRALAEYDVAVTAPRARDVDELRNKIIHHAKEIVAITKRYRTPEGLPLVKGSELLNAEDEAVFLGVALSSNDPTFDLTRKLVTAAAVCEDLANGLFQPQVKEYEQSLQPDVVLLAYFIGWSIQGATRRRAKASVGHMKKPTALEYRRWGLHLSAKTGDLPALCSAIFGRDVTQTQVQHAFVVAKELSLDEQQE